MAKDGKNRRSIGDLIATVSITCCVSIAGKLQRVRLLNGQRAETVEATHLEANWQLSGVQVALQVGVPRK